MTWIGGGLRSEIISKKQWLPKLNRHQTDRAAKDTKSTTKWGCIRTMGMHEWCLDAGMCRHIEWSHPQLTLSWVALQRNNTPQFDADLGPCLASLPVFSAQPPPHPTPHRVVAWKQMSVLVDLLGGGGSQTASWYNALSDPFICRKNFAKPAWLISEQEGNLFSNNLWEDSKSAFHATAASKPLPYRGK